MTETKAKCPIHGELFVLKDGCPQCIADRMGKEGNTEASVAEEIKKVEVLGRHYGLAPEALSEEARVKLTGGRDEMIAHATSPKTALVKVQFYSEATGEASTRPYTYYSEDRLEVGDIVSVPVRGTTTKARVCAVDVPEAEIAAFKDSVKTIPAKAKLEPRAESPPAEGKDITAQIVEASKVDHGLSEPEQTSGPITGIEPPRPSKEALTIAEAEELMAETTALALRPGADVEVISYHTEALKLQKYAEGRIITTPEHAASATDDLSVIAKLKRAMEEKRKGYLEPLKAQVEAINETYKTLMAPVFMADRTTRDKMLAYQQEQERIRLEQEDINRKRQEAAEQEMRLKGELSESVNLVEVAPEVKPVSTELGTAGQRDNWKYEVVDLLAIPREYLVVDNAQLTAIARRHHDKKPVPGVRFYNEPIIAVRAR